MGVASTWLPWLQYDDRPFFLFYAVLTLPPSGRRVVGPSVARSFFVPVLENFAWFWPIWTDGLLTHSEWLDRIWFDRWI